MNKLEKTDFTHKLPKDMKEVIESSAKTKEAWSKITEIAKNEWICWVTIYKKKETREEHLIRLKEDLLAGKKRPCCWPGCPHRNPNAAKYFSKGIV